MSKNEYPYFSFEKRKSIILSVCWALLLIHIILIYKKIYSITNTKNTKELKYGNYCIKSVCVVGSSLNICVKQVKDK